MEYKVVPFTANISQDQGAQTASSQLEVLIKQAAEAGFEYVRLENIPTFVAGNRGCFGLGATPSTSRSYTVAVFKK